MYDHRSLQYVTESGATDFNASRYALSPVPNLSVASEMAESQSVVLTPCGASIDKLESITS